MRPNTPPSLALILAVCSPAPQVLSAQSLGAPVTRWENDFSRLSGVAELPDGRVVIVDNRDGAIFIGPANGGTAAPLGRTGEGPNEYQRPFSVLHGLGDTVLVYSSNRLMRVTPAGAIAGFYPFSPAELGGSVAPPRGMDNAGNVYWDRVVIREPGSETLKRQQLYEIVRWRPNSRGVEVVARASDHAPELHDQRFHPFAQRDAWVVEPDGTVLVLRARDYSAQWVREGRPVRTSPAIATEPIRITAADREAYRRERAANPSGIGRGAPADGSVTPEAMQRMREAYPDNMFPMYKPPFVERTGTLIPILRTPGGHLLVARSPTTASMIPNRIDVLDAQGRRVREITLPPGRRLLSVDRQGIYLAQEDEDGLQYLERYAYPQGLR
jgi:hypothetical protein